MENKDIYQVLVKHDERLKNIYSALGRIEKHLDKLNGRVTSNEKDIAKLHFPRSASWGRSRQTRLHCFECKNFKHGVFPGLEFGAWHSRIGEMLHHHPEIPVWQCLKMW